MRIYVIITSRNEAILRIEETLNIMGVDVKKFLYDSFQQAHKYWYNKTIKNIGQEEKIKQKWYINQNKRLVQDIEQWNPDEILMIGHYISNDFINKYADKIKMWFIDDAENFPITCELRRIRLYTYNQSGMIYFYKNGLNAKYCPVGYNFAYEKKAISNVKQDIDISFIGTPYRERLKILEPVAEVAKKYNWNMKIYGPFFEYPYFWKRLFFPIKYPALSSYKINKILKSQEVAQIYQRSKICLNLHENGNTGTNPRTYEILGAGAFEMIDKRKYYDILQPGKDLIDFCDTSDLIKKIKYYLSNEKERERIALSGHMKVWKKRRMMDSLNYLINN